jgi:hypothetical protein
MNQERMSVLTMLAEGKITPSEAERLLGAMDRNGARAEAGPASGASGKPKYLRVLVDAQDPVEGPTKVNIRVPIQLLRAGVRLSSLMPPAARDKVNAAMAEQGVPFDVGSIKPENLEDLIETINDLTIDVDQERAKVRVFCE